MDRAALIDVLARALALRSDVELALLFGSRARGDDRTGSDVDVGVIARQGADLIDISVALERAAGIPVDVVSLSDAPFPLLLEVLRDGVRVFERSAGSYARFVSSTLAELETDLPNLRRMQAGFTARVAREGLR